LEYQTLEQGFIVHTGRKRIVQHGMMLFLIFVTVMGVSLLEDAPGMQELLDQVFIRNLKRVV